MRFLGFILYLLDHELICFVEFFFTGYSKSCGLPPECNIHCYVLDVSMPKHTMHCTPDLVTVLPWWIIYELHGRVVDWLTSDLTSPRRCSPHDIIFVRGSVLWFMDVHGLPEDNLSQPNSSENKQKKQTNCILTS